MSDINEPKDINEWYYQNFLRKRGYVDSGSQKRVTEEEESPFNLKEELEKARKTPEELYEPLYEGAPPGVYKPAAYSRLFNEIIKNSPDPIAMEGRLNSAYYIAMMEGIPFEEAFDNYESIASAYYGEALAPKSWPKAIETTWKASVLSTEISKLAFKLGQKGGEDAEIEQQIRELESRMPQPDEIKRSLPVQALKAAANFLPSQLESIKSGTVGGALGLTAGAAAGGVLSVVTGGVGSVYIPTIAALGYRIGGNLAAGMKTYELETGALYYDLLKYEERTMNPDGTIKIERINPKVAWQVAQAYGAVAAATEVLPMDHFLKGLGNIAGLGKAIEKSSTSVASAANRSGLAREVVIKFLKSQKSALAEGALDVGLETFQEVIQEMASIVAEDYARDITNSEWGTSLSPISREEASKRIRQTLVDSVMGMGVLAGVKGGVRLMVSGTQTAKTAVEASKIEKAEEKIVGNYTLKPEDLENFRQRAKEPVPENIKIARSTILEGSEYAMHAVDSTTGKVNATVRYEFEPGKEDEPGIVRILGFKGGASPSVNVNLMTSLMKQFPGWEIEFNPKNANQAALKQYLTENNPRGVDAGIQWYSTGRGAPDVNTLKHMNERLKEVAPTWNEKERIAAVNVVNLWAQKLGMTGDQLADKAFAPGIFVPPEGRTLTPEQIERGASGVTTWRHVGESLKAVIDLAPKANVSTVLHESSHAVVNFMLEVRRGAIQVENRDQVLKLLDEMEAALGVENGNWNAPFKGWTGEGAPGNRSHWEALAYALEDYLTFGKPPKPELKNIFERFAIWILDIYNGLKAARVQISPELSAFFDRLFENSKEIFGEDFDALTETEVVQEMKKEGQEPVGEPPKEISEQKKKAEQTQRRQLTALERAKQMETEGRSAEEIEAETGWKKIDGEWKAKREREWEEAPSIEAEKASKEAQKETIKRTNGTSEKAFPIERKEITYKANEAIQNTKWEKLPGKVVLRLLKDYGVTKEELEWTGLDRFLDTDEMITPAQVEDILKANKLELQPVSLDEEYQKRQNEKAISGGENYREHIVSLEDKVIAKIRLDDREDSINRKVLLLEEILKGEEGIPEPIDKGWYEYAFKRLLREAAENYYDSIAWATGEQRGADNEIIRLHNKEIVDVANKIGEKYGVQVEMITLPDAGSQVFSLTLTQEMRDAILSQGETIFKDEKKAPTLERKDINTVIHSDVAIEGWDTWDRELYNKASEKLSKEELIKVLTLNEVSGIPNRRAYREDLARFGRPLPIQASIDADSLKWINDNMGHEAGDKMLQMVAWALNNAAKKYNTYVYHFSGDEYAIQGETIESVIDTINEAEDALSKVIIEAPIVGGGGAKAIVKGLRISAGFDGEGNLHEADNRLAIDKATKESRGERAGRGEIPVQIEIIDVDGRRLEADRAREFIRATEQSRKETAKNKGRSEDDAFDPERIRHLKESRKTAAPRQSIPLFSITTHHEYTSENRELQLAQIDTGVRYPTDEMMKGGKNWSDVVKESIAALRKNQNGIIESAATREPIGNISIPWGWEGTEDNNYTDGIGLANVLKKPEGEEIVGNLENILTKGDIYQDAEDKRKLWFIWGKYRALVSTYRGKGENEKWGPWLVTAYIPEINKSTGQAVVPAGAFKIAEGENPATEERLPAEKSKESGYKRIESLRPAIAEEAQKVYEEWEQDESKIDIEYGTGGICDQIASRIAEILSRDGWEIIDGGWDGDDHAYVIAYNDKEAYAVDIPPDVYESGGGLLWTKKPGVTITPEDVVIYKVNREAIIDENEALYQALPGEAFEEKKELLDRHGWGLYFPNTHEAAVHYSRKFFMERGETQKDVSTIDGYPTSFYREIAKRWESGDVVLLEENKPLYQQNEKVLSALERCGIKVPTQELPDNEITERGYNKNYKLTWGEYWNKLIKDGEPYSSPEEKREYAKRISLSLKNAGIDGIMFLSERKGIAGEAEHNYIVFDDESIPTDKKILLQGEMENQRVKLFQGNEEPDNGASQLYELARQMESEGKTWEDFAEYVEGTKDWLPDSPAAPDLPPDKKLEWYKSVWEEALAVPKKEKDINAWLKDLADNKYEGLRKFLKAIWENVLKREKEEIPYGLTAEDAAIWEQEQQRAGELRQLIAEPLIAGAISVGAKRGVLSNHFLSSVMGIIRANPEEYAAIYGELTGDKEIAKLGAQAMIKKYEDIKDPRLKQRMSISERAALAEQIRDKELERQIISGEVTDERVSAYVEKLKNKIEADKKQLEKLSAELKVAEAAIDARGRQIAEARVKLNQANAEARRIAARIKKYLDNNAEIPEVLESQRVKIEKERARLRKKLIDALDWIEIEKEIDKQKEILNRATREQEEYRARNKEVPEAVLRRKSEANSKIRELQTKLSLAKEYKNSAQLQTYLAKLETETKLKDKIRRRDAERRAAQKLKKYRAALAKSIMRPPGPGINVEYQKAIREIQRSINPENPSARTMESINLLRAELEANPDLAGEIPKKWLRRALGKNLNEMTLEELEATERRIRELRAIGREKQRIIEQQRAELYEAYRAAVLKPIMSLPSYKEPQGYEREKSLKEQFLSKVKEIDYAWMNAQRFAERMDGGKQGQNYELLILERDRNYRLEMRNVAHRKMAILNGLRELGVDVSEWFNKKITIVGAGPGRSDKILRKTDLLAIELAFRDEHSLQAVLFGDFFSEKERSAMTEDELYLEGAERFAKIRAALDANLTEKDLEALDKIFRKDAKETGKRLSKTVAEANNREMEEVEEYFPILREGVTGEPSDVQIAGDLLNRTKGLKRPPKDSFTKTRLNISPKHQSPVKLDLLTTWMQSIDLQEHYIANVMYGKMLDAVYLSPLVQEQIRAAFGDAGVDYIKEYIAEIKNPGSLKNYSRWEKSIRWLRGNLGAAYLTFRASSVLVQILTSPWPALPYAGPRLFTEALKMMTNPVKYLRETEAMSTVLTHRTWDVSYEIMKERAEANGILKGFNALSVYGMKGMELADRFSVAVGWRAMFEAELAKNGGDVQKAIERADDLTLRVQPSARGVDLAPIYRRGGEGTKLLLQFTQALNVVYQNIRYDVPLAVKNHQWGVAIGTIVGYAIAGILLNAARSGPEDEDEKNKYLFWAITQATESFPLIGSELTRVMRRAITGKKEAPIEDTALPGINKILDAMYKISGGDIENGLVEFAKGGGMVLGMPVSGIREAYLAVSGHPEALLGRPVKKE